jgi:uncharacterized protein YjbI with pentapeptide repeats
MPDRATDRPATGTTLAAPDWFRADLGGVEHERVLVDGGDATEALATGARFVDSTFRGTDLTLAEFTASAFENCTFVRCRLAGARFAECKLVGSVFVDCTLERLDVDRGDWSFVDLAGADLRHTRFDGVRLVEADLSGVRAERAVLTGCVLDRARLDRADLTRADLRGSRFDVLDPNATRLAGAVVDWDQALVVAASLGLDVRAQ